MDLEIVFGSQAGRGMPALNAVVRWVLGHMEYTVVFLKQSTILYKIINGRKQQQRDEGGLGR
jgi:hypothetical protein